MPFLLTLIFLLVVFITIASYMACHCPDPRHGFIFNLIARLPGALSQRGAEGSMRKPVA